MLTRIAEDEPWLPSDASALRDIVVEAARAGFTLDVRGGGSKAGLGRPMRADRVVDLSRLSGVVDYEPSELVITARAATPLAEIETLLAASGQALAFEPPDWSGLLGSGHPTLGGVIACNVAGPRRVRAGAARDHTLGLAAVNGRGEAWRAGGKVVKNVTGYDMCKLQAGAFGTLSVLTELSVRVMPRPETACTVMLRDLDENAAVVAMARALNAPHEVSAAAHLPGSRRTAFRLEGPVPSVAFRAAALERTFGRADRLDAAESAGFWSQVGSVHELIETRDRVVWRLCPVPSAAASVVERIRGSWPSADAFYDWGGGLVWLSLPSSGDAGAAVVRAAIDGGGATLFVAPDAVRETVPVFDPQPGPLASLAGRVKDSFDPHRILNPGRMREES